MSISMLSHQRGALNLYFVGIGFTLLAAVAMLFLMSARLDRNLFAEGMDKAGKMVEASPAQQALDAAKHTAAGTSGEMRKCVINGKTVISNADCTDQNPTSKTIKIQVTRGVEAPKLPPPPPSDGKTAQQRGMDKWIDKQSQ
jgi:hypothetical protein